MMAAFDFVPGVAADAIVPLAGSFDNRQPFFYPALIDQMGSNLIFDACPHFVRIHKRKARLPAVGPGAENQPGFVVEDVGALAVDMIVKIGAEIVVEYRFDGAADMFSREQIAEAGNACVKLAEQLVGKTAKAMLVFVGIHIIQLLDVVFAVPEHSIEILAALLEGSPAALREGLFSHN